MSPTNGIHTVTGNLSISGLSSRLWERSSWGQVSFVHRTLLRINFKFLVCANNFVIVLTNFVAI